MEVPSSTVREVSVVATGSGSLHPEHMYGSRKPALWWVARSKEWITIPLNVFVIEHDDGLVLFDTGIDPAAANDPDYWPDRITRWFLHHVFRFDVNPGDSLSNKLDEAGYQAKDVKVAVLSHLHFDHAGGVGDLPNAEIFVAPEAWDHLINSPHPERDYIPRQHIIKPGATWRVMEFTPTDDPDLAPFTTAFDVMGDGSLMVVPTPGHAPGSVSMLIRRTDAAPVLLVGDLTYSEELLMQNRVAGTGDKALLLESFATVQSMKANHPQLVVIASHDTTATQKLAAATHDRAIART